MTCLAFFYCFLALILISCSQSPHVMEQSACAPECLRQYPYQKDGAEPSPAVNPADVPALVPHKEPKSRYGNPDHYSVYGKTYYVLKSAKGFRQRGKASWYGKKFHGARTSSGEPYNMYALSAAHKTLPLPTYVRVTNLRNQRSVIVRVNDRGPFHSDRIIDLSYTAAWKLGMLDNGVTDVEISALDNNDFTPQNPVSSRQLQSTRSTTNQVHSQKTVTPISYYIQAGAFASRENARKTYRQLKQTFPNLGVFMHYHQQNHQLLSIIKLGPVAINHAAMLLRQIQSMGLTQAHLIQ